MRIATVEQMRELDRGAIEKYGIEDLLLMENAALAVYEVIRTRYGAKGVKVTVLCGGGNNGGDGFAVARKLHSAGAAVTAVLLGDPGKARGSAGKNLEICRKAGIPMVRAEDREDLIGPVFSAEVLVDALFGTGLSRDVEGLYADAVALINDAGVPVVSVDIPSGINGDSGEVMGAAVEADATVTFGLPKPGNILYPGSAHCGNLYVTHISFPPEHYNQTRLTLALNTPPPLLIRDPSGHKGTFGNALFIAGAASYYGAPALCSRSFLKTGGGYSRLAAPGTVIRVIAGQNPEIVYHPQEEGDGGGIALTNLDGLLETAEQCDFAVIGPGMGRHPDTQKLIAECVKQIGKPVLLDADGLNAVAGRRELFRSRKAPTVITPHPGEMARLLDRSAQEIASRPVESARAAAEEYSSIVVLKGARSCIAEPEGRVWINTTGNPGMATAGAGDVLSGVIPACYCLRLESSGLEEAVCAGVYIHGLAGDLAAEVFGQDGMTAADIMEALPEAVRIYRKAGAVTPSIEVE